VIYFGTLNKAFFPGPSWSRAYHSNIYRAPDPMDRQPPRPEKKVLAEFLRRGCRKDMSSPIFIACASNAATNTPRWSPSSNAVSAAFAG
jgi:hypothetical protein